MPDMSANATDERRRNPRIEILAQAEVIGQEIRIMEVRDISLGGIFLVGTPDEYPDLTPGVDLDLAISASEADAAEDPDANVACHARIIRVDKGDAGNRPPGFGATIAPVDDENRERLTKLLSRAGQDGEGDLTG
jgi:hypothetical protein